MAQTNTNPSSIKELLERGVEKIYPEKKELSEKLSSGKRLRLYCGFDPSASSLHIGNAIALIKMAQFQQLGHEVIFLIGSFTGMIGDPTDKKAARKQLSREEVMENAKNFKKQAEAYLNFSGDNPASLRYNSEWQDKVTFKDLIELSSHFTVQQMIQRDMFQKRLSEEKPIFLHEFLYPLAQAYDSVAMDVDLEIGGNDQMFNMMCGRDLLKATKNKEKSVITMKLLTDSEGRKMGKSEGNIVMLDASASDMYGQVMAWPDDVIPSAFELCTFLPWEEAMSLGEQLKDEKINPRDLKMRLAFEITKINHGEKEARAAEDNFVRTIQKKELPDDIEEKEIAKGSYPIIDLVFNLGLSSSRGEARRLIEQGGIKFGFGQELRSITEPQAKVEVADKMIIQRGKRQFVKIKLSA